MELYESSHTFTALDEGIHSFKNKEINKKPFDIIVINDKKNLITLLYPLSEKQTQQVTILSGLGLSNQEMCIIKLILEGKSNSDVCKELNITHATIRTHLGNIYKKLPAKIREDLIKTRTRTKNR